jgi:type II secretory pathway component PulK
MKTRSRRTGGFALVTVVVMIAFAGVAAMAISAGFAAESRRVRVNGTEAQLRQLLLAGALRAADNFNLRDRPSQRFTEEMKLSGGWASDGASVLIVGDRDAANAGRGFADITATLGRAHAHQRVTFELVKAKWVMIDARLE